ncbi:MAG: hypothetical protein EHV01_004770 [Spiroplasma sp. hy2]|uniref:hypothetical protein n=1 Tax=Spiroplasma sp. hy2 TaxID=2490850 RepID=UPI003843D9C7
MKKLLSLLSVLAISGSAVPTTIAASPYQKEETINSDINYQQINNLEKLNRNKRQYQTDISTYVTQTDLGTIRPGSSSGGVISDLRILNAFVRANPNLPRDLQATAGRSRIIYVSANYGNRAIIDVHSGTSYTGSIQVTFNGGQIPTEENYSSGLNSNWHSRLNLSTTYVNRILNNIIDTNERTIIESFLLNNQHLPAELINILRVSNVSRSSATIYVPEGNLRYQGNLIVSFSTNQNSYYGSSYL